VSESVSQHLIRQREVTARPRSREPLSPGGTSGLLARLGKAGNRAVTGALIQRKCACGGGDRSPCHCEEEDEKALSGIQHKLTVNEPGDQYEQEADRVADQVMRMPAGQELHRDRDGPTIHPLAQRRVAEPARSLGGGTDGLADRLADARTEGRQLDPALCAMLEPRFGVDFSAVRIHTGPAAAHLTDTLDATAFTHGRDVYFAPGMFSPDTQPGRRLLAHELTHVVQQTGGVPAGNSSVIARQPKAAAPEEKRTDPVVSLGPLEEAMIGAATLPLEAVGSTPRRLVAATLRGFALEIKAEMTGDLGDRLWQRFVELGTSPRVMIGFVLHYWWGLIKGIFSPITGLFDLVKLAFTMQQLQTQLLMNAWTRRAGLAADAAKMAEDLGNLGVKLSGALADLRNQPPDQVIKTISGWLDQLKDEAEKAAGTAGSKAAQKLLANLDVPMAELGELAGEIIGTILINLVLFIFTEGIGNAITQIAGKLGQLGAWLGRFGKVAQMLGRIAVEIGELLGVVGGWVTRAEQAIAKVAEALLRPLKPVLDEIGKLLGGLRSFLRRLLGVAEEEATTVLASAAGKGGSALTEDITKSVPPIRTAHASEGGVVFHEGTMPPVERVRRPSVGLRDPGATGTGALGAPKAEPFPDLPTGVPPEEAVTTQGPLSELEGPQRLPNVTNLESIEVAREAGIPDLLTADGTVMTRSDFPELLPDAPPLTGRPSPPALATPQELLTEGRPVSVSAIQNLEVRADAQLLLDAGANPASLRVNQAQVIDDLRVGTNRPDFHAELNGHRVHIEYDRAPPTRALDHARRILSNDPDAIVILKVVDWE
jgi:uncharacterized protein DUF4157